MNSLFIVRNARAEDDLIAIWLHVARDSEVAADRLLDRIEARWQQLETYPFSGRRAMTSRPASVICSLATISPCIV